MRLLRLAAAVATASMLAATPAFAGFYEDVAVARGIPPIGYVCDPVDPGSPVFIANQGPVLAGPGVYAPHEIGMPTHPGYAVVTPFPYVRHVPDVRVFSRPHGIAPYAISVYWPEPRARFRHARIRHAR